MRRVIAGFVKRALRTFLDDFDYSRFFYRVIRPLLFEALWKNERFLLHGSALLHPCLGVTLILGPSGSGKSTLCATLGDLPGSAFLTDDTILMYEREGSAFVGTVHRKLHLDPTLGHKIPSLSGIEVLPPYGGRSTKVAVSAADIFNCVVDVLRNVDLVVFPRITTDITSKATVLHVEETLRGLIENSFTGISLAFPQTTWNQALLLSNVAISCRGVSISCGLDAMKAPLLCFNLIEQAVRTTSPPASTPQL